MKTQHQRVRRIPREKDEAPKRRPVRRIGLQKEDASLEKVKPKKGRKVLYNKKLKEYCIGLDTKHVETARAAGNGNLSAGIRLLIERSIDDG